MVAGDERGSDVERGGADMEMPVGDGLLENSYGGDVGRYDIHVNSIVIHGFTIYMF